MEIAAKILSNFASDAFSLLRIWCIIVVVVSHSALGICTISPSSGVVLAVRSVLSVVSKVGVVVWEVVLIDVPSCVLIRPAQSASRQSNFKSIWSFSSQCGRKYSTCLANCISLEASVLYEYKKSRVPSLSVATRTIGDCKTWLSGRVLAPVIRSRAIVSVLLTSVKPYIMAVVGACEKGSHGVMPVIKTNVREWVYDMCLTMA